MGVGAGIVDVERRLEVSVAAFHWWRNQYGGLKADGVKRLKVLGIGALGEISRSRWWVRCNGVGPSGCCVSGSGCRGGGCVGSWAGTGLLSVASRWTETRTGTCASSKRGEAQRTVLGGGVGGRLRSWCAEAGR